MAILSHVIGNFGEKRREPGKDSDGRSAQDYAFLENSGVKEKEPLMVSASSGPHDFRNSRTSTKQHAEQLPLGRD